MNYIYGGANMKKKYTEFYFENDRNYSDDAYWDLYDFDRQEAIKKYKGHMFCPECQQAPIVPVQTRKTRYLKVTRIDKHESGCSNANTNRRHSQTDGYEAELTISDIQSRLQSYIDDMIKSDTVSNEFKKTKMRKPKEEKRISTPFEQGKQKYKRTSCRNFNKGSLEKDLGKEKFFRGKGSLYIKSYVPESESEVKMYYLKVLNSETNKQIFDIAIPSYRFDKMDKIFKGIPTKKQDAKGYYLCIETIMEKTAEGFYTCKLDDARKIAILEENR